MGHSFQDSERFVRENGLGTSIHLNSTGQWLSTTQLLYREARRRGWVTRRLGEGVVGFFEGDKLVTTTYGLSTAVVGANAEFIARSKSLTREFLSEAGLPVPRGSVFKSGKIEDGWTFASEISGPVVLKPSDGSKGQGVSTGVTSREEFEVAWKRAANRKQGAILVEEEVHGLDTRAFVIDRKVVAAVTRIPPFVVGDGNRTVGELVDNALEKRSKNAYLKRFGISIDQRTLRQQDIEIDSRLRRGRVVFLNGTNNVSQGGYSIDTTDLLGSELKKLAVEAVRAVPNLKIAGVDIIAKEFNRKQAYLLELNADAAIWLHHYPSFGKSRPVAQDILDYQLLCLQS